MEEQAFSTNSRRILGRRRGLALPRRAALFLAAGALLSSAGCVERTMTFQTNPSGAVVTLNGKEFGRTPVTKDFLWYGTYDVVVRKDGYHTYRGALHVVAPAYQWVPIDLLAELLPIPLRDVKTYAFYLQPDPASGTGGESADALRAQTPQLLERADQLKAQLQSSQYPKPAPTTRPSHKTKKQGQ